MTLFRLRRWGSEAWVQVEVRDPEESGLEEEATNLVQTALTDTGYHVQICNEKGEWEDLL